MKARFVFFLAFCFHSSFGQSSRIKFLIDTSISIMKHNAVNANNVNWDTITKKVLIKADGISDPYKLGPVMRYLYQSLNDFHGAFFYKDSTFRWQRCEPVISDSIRNEWKKGVHIETRILQRNIGYLRIPSIPVASQNDFNTKAQGLNDSLCSMLTKDIKGIILDLRLNGGGAMQPMILGVEQLLAKGYIGSFRTKQKADWMIKNNGFYVDTVLLSKIKPVCSSDVSNMPVVILSSPITGSSAECFVIAFKGRKNTILLGSKTAGYTTVNMGFPIDDTAFMNLSIGYSADKYGNIYKAAIAPDIAFKSVDKFNDINNDEKVKAAQKWLIKHFK